jgi:anthranilate phosphoribosyltransferase
MKGESANELAGFTDALSARFAVDSCEVELDIDAHGDGHAGRPTLLWAAACAVAALGVRVLVRAELRSPYARHGLFDAVTALGADGAHPFHLARARATSSECGLALLDLPSYNPALAALVALRPKLGLRTCAQTLQKLASPASAKARLVGVFHAPYLAATAQALAALGGPDASALCVQALGGLPEVSPGKIVRIARASVPEPATLDLRALEPAQLDLLALDGCSAADANQRALEGDPAFAPYVAATGALFLHAARGEELASAAQTISEALKSGRGRKVAERFAQIVQV